MSELKKDYSKWISLFPPLCIMPLVSIGCHQETLVQGKDMGDLHRIYMEIYLYVVLAAITSLTL